MTPFGVYKSNFSCAKARDRGHPVRFDAAAREHGSVVAARHHDVVLVDLPRVRRREATTDADLSADAVGLIRRGTFAT